MKPAEALMSSPAGLPPEVLAQLVAGSVEPMLVARTDRPDWPVVLSNPAFDALFRLETTLEQPFADVAERLVGRELAVEVSETVRAGDETTLPVVIAGRDYLLVLKPLTAGAQGARFYAAYWRGGATGLAPNGEVQKALARARRRIRDLSRDDPVTGMLNEAAFRDVLIHDWAVAARENTSLALVAFTVDDFMAYLEVFGRHATDSCMRRIAQTIRRSLRRASDVAARIGEDTLVVLAHASEERGVDDFAARIGALVRGLGLHHPRSSVAKFVTVSCRIAFAKADPEESGEQFLEQVIERGPGGRGSASA